MVEGDGMSELKPKQWFIDRIGKTVTRYFNTGVKKLDEICERKGIPIKDESQAQYMFDIQQEFYHESGITLNYRDKKK